MKRQVITTTQFKKDARRALKRGWPEKALREVILRLAEDAPLEPSRRDHALTGPSGNAMYVPIGCWFTARLGTN